MTFVSVEFFEKIMSAKHLKPLILNQYSNIENCSEYLLHKILTGSHLLHIIRVLKFIILIV